jgi:hypothetical protein
MTLIAQIFTDFREKFLRIILVGGEQQIAAPMIEAWTSDQLLNTKYQVPNQHN